MSRCEENCVKKTAHRENDDMGGFYPFAVWSMFRDGRYRKDGDRRRGIEP